MRSMVSVQVRNKLCKAGKARSADKIRNVANVEA